MDKKINRLKQEMAEATTMRRKAFLKLRADGKSDAEVAEDWGISRQRVSQILAAALKQAEAECWEIPLPKKRRARRKEKRKMEKTTPWFPGNIKPARRGVYQQMCGHGVALGYQYWNGAVWFGWRATP